MGVLEPSSPRGIGLREREWRPSELRSEIRTRLKVDEQEKYPHDNAEEILVAN
jgi:hypothetical protein